MARGYVFRLETLLRLRCQREDEQKRIVASRLRKIRTIEEQKHVLELRITDQTGVMRTLLCDPAMQVDELKAGRHWMVRLRRGVLEADAAIAAHKAMLAQERAELAEARKSSKVLDQLKQRQREAYLAELARAEQSEVDDLNVTRHARALLCEDSGES
ncbi:MAG: flagellar FliJ family protein [Planctomycetota bacterium]